MKVEPRIQEIARKLRDFRESKHLTRDKFCEMTHQDTNYWGTIERGKRGLSLAKLLEICDTFHVPPQMFFPPIEGEENVNWDLERIVEKLKPLDQKQLLTVETFVDKVLPGI